MTEPIDLEYTLDLAVVSDAPVNWQEIVDMWESTVAQVKHEAWINLDRRRYAEGSEQYTREYCKDLCNQINRANHIIGQANALISRARSQGFVMPTLAEIEREIDTKQIGMTL